MATENIEMDYSKYDFKDSTEMYVHLSKKGLSKETVIDISKMKDEPQWMLDFRLRSYEIFMQKPMPNWGADLSAIDFQNIYYYAKATEKTAKSWDDVPEDVKNTFDKLGIPEAEKKFLAGVGAQYESEVVYHSLREDLAKQGVLFLDTDTALKEQPEIFKKYFGKMIPPEDNKFAALNSAVRTLIIVDEGAEVHYIEGCTAPVYSSESLHCAVVELLAHKDAKLRYTTIQNWSSDVYNLVTKRAYAYEGATVEWIDGNIGSKITMKYPGIYLLGERAYGETLSVAFAGKNQHQDTGAKMIHLAPNTTSKTTSKSVSRLNGRSTYRGLLKVAKGATNVKTITHEATVGKIGDEQIFYLMTRGFTEEESLSLIVNGFMEPFTKELPMEYAVELNRLIKLEMDGSVG
jgi:Fe-S cluster assembly protein SufB